jgi:hypothetical protein
VERLLWRTTLDSVTEIRTDEIPMCALPVARVLFERVGANRCTACDCRSVALIEPAGDRIANPRCRPWKIPSADSDNKRTCPVHSHRRKISFSLSAHDVHQSMNRARVISHTRIDCGIVCRRDDDIGVAEIDHAAVRPLDDIESPCT